MFAATAAKLYLQEHCVPYRMILPTLVLHCGHRSLHCCSSSSWARIHFTESARNQLLQGADTESSSAWLCWIWVATPTISVVSASFKSYTETRWTAGSSNFRERTTHLAALVPIEIVLSNLMV